MKNKEVTTRDLRIFGLIWGIIFTVIAYNSDDLRKLFIIISIAFFSTAALSPEIYLKTKIYQNWVKFGNILGKINGFLISSILFYVIFAPVGIVLRLLKKDLLSKKLDKAAASYFIDRKDQPGDMKNQF